MTLHLEWAKRLKKAGATLGRDGLSKRAAAIMVDLVTKSGSYKEAMIAAGRLKAVAAAAKYDGYWTEKVDEGYHTEMAHLEWMARGAATAQSPQDRSLADALDNIVPNKPFANNDTRTMTRAAAALRTPPSDMGREEVARDVLSVWTGNDFALRDQVIETIRRSKSLPTNPSSRAEQEPVAWICWYHGNCDATALKSRAADWIRLGRKVEPLYDAPPAAPADGVRKAFRNADDLDWEHLDQFIPQSGHGQFWRAVFAEVRAALNSAVSRPNRGGSDGQKA